MSKSRKKPDPNAPSGLALDRLLSPAWAPPSLFVAFTIIYFVGFLTSSDVMQGLDTRMEFYLGKEPASEKFADLAPENWSRYLGGTPVSGFRQPKYFPLYPIYAFTSYHRYLGWRYVFSTFFAGYFTYLCVRGLRLRRSTAVFAGIAYASSPTLLTFIYPGQEGKMLVMGLLPLMVWALYRIVDTRRLVFMFVLAAGVAGGIYTPHLQMLYYALIGLGILFLVRLVQTYLAEHDARRATIRCALSAGGIVLGLAVGAVGTFPAYKYTKTESRRAGAQGQGVSLEYAQSWPLHPEEVASLLVPEFVHFYKPHENTNFYWGRNALKLNAEYFGIVVLFFAALAVARVRRDPRVLPLLVLSLITLAFALGPHTPVFLFFYQFVPGMNVLRTPGMIAFLFAFPAVILAALTVERFLEDTDHEHPWLLYGSVATVVVLLAVALAPEITLSAWISTFWPEIPKAKMDVALANLPELSSGAGLAALWITILAALAYGRILGKVPAQTFLIGLLPILLIDTWRIDKQYLKYVDPNRYPDPDVFIPQTLSTITSDKDYNRTWIPTRDVQLPESVDLLTVDYHEPFILRRYDRLTEHLLQSLVEGRGEHVFRLMNLLNVKYVAIGAQRVRAVLPALALPGETDQSVQLKPGVEAVANERNTYLFRNLNAHPFFYLAQRSVVAADEDDAFFRIAGSSLTTKNEVVVETDLRMQPGPPLTTNEEVNVEIFDESQGVIRLNVVAEHPRILVICQNYHPYWSAEIDGKTTALYRANYVWQAITVPPGRHTVQLTYDDKLAELCRWISLVSTIGLVAGLVLLSTPSLAQRQLGAIGNSRGEETNN